MASMEVVEGAANRHVRKAELPAGLIAALQAHITCGTTAPRFHSVRNVSQRMLGYSTKPRGGPVWPKRPRSAPMPGGALTVQSAA